MIYHLVVEKDVQKGDVSEGYSVSPEEKGLFPLMVKSAHTNQTALYLCSGSVQQWKSSACPSVHKPASVLHSHCFFDFMVFYTLFL
jgi:hypothetical protein